MTLSTVSFAASAMEGADASPAISLTSATTLLLVAAVLILLKIVADLRSRVAALEANATSAPPAPAAAASAPATAAPPVRPATEAVSNEVLTVIAAAVHASLGSRHRVVSVTPAHDDRHAWSLEGRRQILHSHKLR